MKFTLSMAAYDDYDGLFFTIQALRMYHPVAEMEILVLDNNPSSPHGEALRGFARGVPQVRVIPVTDRASSFIKYDCFKHATGDVIIGMDCHILLMPGAIQKLVEHWQMNPDSPDLVTGPLVYNDLTSLSSHMDPTWRGLDFGTWGTSKEDLDRGSPFEVPMQGMGFFSFRRAAWKGINPDFRQFGGEEWYVAEKVRSWGGRVMCLPQVQWMHRFDWPKRTFPLTNDAKVLNYYRGWLEVYGSLEHPMVQDMTAYWKTVMPESKLESLIQQAQTPLS